ncbi:MAG TPA: hypothetical protein HA224_01880 [Nanoarchaeota archaeon]|nr:hypothetical protein [Nanoarchaeota archaeon]
MNERQETQSKLYAQNDALRKIATLQLLGAGSGLFAINSAYQYLIGNHSEAYLSLGAAYGLLCGRIIVKAIFDRLSRENLEKKI